MWLQCVKSYCSDFDGKSLNIPRIAPTFHPEITMALGHSRKILRRCDSKTIANFGPPKKKVSEISLEGSLKLFTISWITGMFVLIYTATFRYELQLYLWIPSPTIRNLSLKNSVSLEPKTARFLYRKYAVETSE